MKPNKILVLVLVIMMLVVSIGTALAVTVTRTIEGQNYTYVGSTTKNITINLTGSPPGNFSLFWGAIETLPENINVVLLTANADVIKVNAVSWSFASINGNTLRYNITANNSAIPGFYLINGTFKDDMNMSGIISENMNIRIAPNNTISIISAYDTNGIVGIQKEEVLNAVWDYFFYIINLDNTLLVVRTYLGL